MKTFLRFLLLLSLVIWVGGIIFFSAVEAPYVFHMLMRIPDGQHLAGGIIADSIHTLHVIGVVCGVIAFVCLLLMGDLISKLARFLISAMTFLTAISQLEVTPRMEEMRTAGLLSDWARARFDRLHTVSVTFEAVTLLCGLLTLWFVAHERSE